MKPYFYSFVVGAALLIGTPGANAQIFGGDRDDSRYRDHHSGDDGYYRNGGYSNNGYNNSPRGNYSRSIVDQVQADLSRAASNAYTDNHERGHFDQAQQSLQDFQGRWARGRFDKAPLDRAVTSLQHLVNSNQLNGRDRSILADDLNALRQFRSSGGQYGYGQNGYNRRSNSGYTDDRYPSRDYPRRY